jgi:hypothetical protein
MATNVNHLTGDAKIAYYAEEFARAVHTIEFAKATIEKLVAQADEQRDLVIRNIEIRDSARLQITGGYF